MNSKIDKEVFPETFKSFSKIKANYEENYAKLDFKEFLRTTIKELSFGLNINFDKIEKELDDEALLKAGEYGAISSLKRVLLPLAEAISPKTIEHTDYAILAGRLELHRIILYTPETLESLFSEIPQVFTKEYLGYCQKNFEELESIIDYRRDYYFTFFGIRTLEKTYLIKIGENQFYETPQRMYLRVATSLWHPQIEKIKEIYDLLSFGYFTHATPTLSNSGIRKGSLSSCFLLSVKDSLSDIFDCLKSCALISKSMGGIGLDVSNIRHSEIGHFGMSNGIVPMLQVYDKAMKYADQGGGKRKGSATIFLQPWHVDFQDFLELRRPHGVEERRARDLFYAVWCCDLFMDRVKNDEIWSLFCPKKAPGLTETYGRKFEKLYKRYENEGIFERQVPARELWAELIKSQIETGMPFMAHKETANFTSNQMNLGLIRSSNLCMEITEVTDGDTISSCNLASIALNNFAGELFYDFEGLGQATRNVVRSINQVIDRTFYPLSKENKPGPVKSTNLKYRPLGIGVQGLAETFMKLGYSWEDPEARELNKHIFACIYYHAVSESCKMAKETGAYEGFEGSPASQGLLKFDLMAMETARKKLRNKDHTQDDFDNLVEEILKEKMVNIYDWTTLKKAVQKHGLKNSLLVALMPTASTAQIRNNTESFEPISSNMYERSVLSGKHIVVNKFLIEKFEKLGIWTKSVRNSIMANNGSVQHLPLELVSPERQDYFKHLISMFKTAYELKQKLLLDFSIDRSFYVCQSQSLNIHMADPTYSKLNALHFYAWENGLTTGMYYLRSKPATGAIKFTVEGEIDVKRDIICTDEICISCGA